MSDNPEEPNTVDDYINILKNYDIIKKDKGGYKITKSVSDDIMSFRRDFKEHDAREIINNIPYAENIEDLNNKSLLPYLMALYSKRIPYETNEVETMAKILDKFHLKTPNNNTEIFLPLEVEDLEAFLEVEQYSILLFWDETERSSIVANDLEELFTHDFDPSKIALGTLYGPTLNEDILQRYHVAIFPTALFMNFNNIQSRVVGAPPRISFKRELKILTEN